MTKLRRTLKTTTSLLYKFFASTHTKIQQPYCPFFFAAAQRRVAHLDRNHPPSSSSSSSLPPSEMGPQIAPAVTLALRGPMDSGRWVAGWVGGCGVMQTQGNGGKVGRRREEKEKRSTYYRGPFGNIKNETMGKKDLFGTNVL